MAHRLSHCVQTGVRRKWLNSREKVHREAAREDSRAWPAAQSLGIGIRHPVKSISRCGWVDDMGQLELVLLLHMLKEGTERVINQSASFASQIPGISSSQERLIYDYSVGSWRGVLERDAGAECWRGVYWAGVLKRVPEGRWWKGIR